MHTFMFAPQFETVQALPAAPSIEDIIVHATSAGSMFFTPTMMEAYGSEVYPNVYTGPQGVCFVTSETVGTTGNLQFSVRQFDTTTRRVVFTGLRYAGLGEAYIGAAVYAGVDHLPMHYAEPGE